jgi:hypothetical protein
MISKIKKKPDPRFYGNCYVSTAVASGMFALLGEDYFRCNCNGDGFDTVIAYGDSQEELEVWAAVNGLDMSGNFMTFKTRYPIAG